MKKFTLSLVLLCLTYSVFAQETSTCSEGKIARINKIKKKSRAALADNDLMNQYDVHHYFLDLNVERNSTVISGAVTIQASIVAASLDTFAFELNSSLSIDSIQVNGLITPYIRSSNMSYVLLSNAMLQNNNISVTIYYAGDAHLVGGSALGDGFATDTSPSWGNEVTWSLSEPYSAYEWFPCKQALQDKADSATVYVTTDSANKVGSNGVLQGIDTGLPNNKIRYRWKTNYIIDYYLISIAVAKYIDYSIYAHPSAMPNDSIKIQNYVYDNPATLTAFQSKIDSVALVIEYFSDILGLYPFAQEKYGHCMAPISGGMEHQTMTTMGNLGSFSTNAHELFHQWFGDHVTCKTWKDIFMNEGFASYGEYLAYDHFRGHAAAQAKMLNVHSDVLQDPTAMVYFTDTTDVNRIFDSRLTYNKGSAVIHTLRFVLGDSLFFKGLKDFQMNYAFSTASILDFKASMESSSGVNLSDYFNQWLFGEGYPIYSAEYYSNGTNMYLKISHTASSTFTPLFKTPLEIKCLSASGDTIIKVNIAHNIDTFLIPINKTITGLAIDPNNWILNTEGTITVNSDLVPLSNSNFKLSNFTEAFPTPCYNYLQLSSSIHQNKFSIRSTSGIIISKGTFETTLKLNSTNWSKGIYFVEIQNEKGSTTHKISKF